MYSRASPVCVAGCEGTAQARLGSCGHQGFNIHIRDWEDLSKLHTTVLDLGSSLKRDGGKLLPCRAIA